MSEGHYLKMDHPPKSICILRLSALGDVTHMIPVVRSIQKFWPATDITWVIGKKEASLVSDLPGIEFIEFDKSKFVSSYLGVFKKIRNRKFDVLLCAQVSLRSNIISAIIPASLKLGYDQARSKDFHSWFVDQQIAAKAEQHVLDSFFGFIEHLGLHDRDLVWEYNIPQQAYEFANQHLLTNRFKIIISPCSSHSLRNWNAQGYAAVADYAIQTLDAQVILCGGPSSTEKTMGEKIEHNMQNKALNLIGKDSLKKFLALLQGVDVLIAPDSGPVHMAAGLGTPVIGLYAASNPKRSGPYFSQQWCVNKYEAAARTYKNSSVAELKWGTKLEREGAMNLIEVKDVTSKLSELFSNHLNNSRQPNNG